MKYSDTQMDPIAWNNAVGDWIEALEDFTGDLDTEKLDAVDLKTLQSTSQSASNTVYDDTTYASVASGAIAVFGYRLARASGTCVAKQNLSANTVYDIAVIHDTDLRPGIICGSATNQGTFTILTNGKIRIVPRVQIDKDAEIYFNVLYFSKDVIDLGS